MHRNTLSPWRTVHWSRIPGTTKLVTVLTHLLTVVSREARPPWTRSIMVLEPVMLTRPVTVRIAGNLYRNRRNHVK